MVVGCDVIGFMALLFDFGLLIKPVVLVSCQASCNGTYTYTLGQLSHAVRGHAVGMWPSAPKALRACTRVARSSNVARGSNVAFGP